MLERWLRTPEVARWWGDPAEQFALLKEDFGEPLMRQWIVEYGQRPFAYAQAYEVDQKHFRLGAQQLRRFELGTSDLYFMLKYHIDRTRSRLVEASQIAKAAQSVNPIKFFRA
jgi:hypothetical protein